MDDLTRNSILAAAEELFDRERLYKLASSVGEARSRKDLRYWQESMLAELSILSGIDVTQKATFIEVFKGTKERYAPPKPDNTAEGVLKTMKATWAESSEMERWIQWAARDLSKIGTLSSYVQCYRALAKFLTFDQVRDLYIFLRDNSMRSESEWRHEFLRFFKRTINESCLPAPFHDDHWRNQAAAPRSMPINPQTGLPWNE